jgi:hypothetical protein
MITYSVENNMNTLLELDDLGMLGQNFMEVDPRGLSSSFRLNVIQAQALIDNNMFEIVVARNTQSNPVGYIIMCVSEEDLFCCEPVATTVCTFLDVKYRKSTVFPRMLRMVEDRLKERGVTHYTIGLLPEGTNLEKHGYHLDTKNYSKALTEPSQ